MKNGIDIMREAKYQSDIIKGIERLGGVAINGVYSKAGEADLQCGVPKEGKLLHLAIEVKTKKDYDRIMSGVTLSDGLYVINNESKLKPNEYLQIEKLNRNRLLGGLALLAYDIEQVINYINNKDIVYETPRLPNI